MKALLDTHVLIWWVIEPPRLSDLARDLIGDEGHTIFASAVSGFEIANKHRLGKWPEVATLVLRFPAVVRAERFELVDLSCTQAVIAGYIQSDHRDPFDRMIAAQAADLAVPVVTADPMFATLGVQTIW